MLRFDFAVHQSITRNKAMQHAIRSAILGFAVLTSVPLLANASASAKDGYGAGKTQQQFTYSNRLIDSNDPYLLMHAHNPVDWYPWGPEALAKARRENRPIFISIGYSTCYWCHVAERTLYSDPEIARLMNQWFVNIKIDREQRPDLDSIYMLATQLLNGNGGWPNNVFLTPDLKPFYAGGYFPASDDEFGRPGFPTVLKALHAAWVNKRPEMERQANAVYTAMQKVRQQSDSGAEAPVKPVSALSLARDEIVHDYDATHGGIGAGPTKFPREPSLNLLLEAYQKTHDAMALEVLTKTLDAMAFGGIHDQLGGGFHRYSTEPTWSVPHFEKMLYDNAQLLMIYARAYEITHTDLYRQVAEDIANYLAQQMMAPGGGFYAAQDAQVDGIEGGSYLWSRKEIESILGKDEAEQFFQVYALPPVPGLKDPMSTESEDMGVLRVRVPVTETLQRIGGKDIALVLASFEQDRARLLAMRARRAQPFRDDKIIVSWNAMAIAALARSGQILGKPGYVKLAQITADKLWAQAFDHKRGRLSHEMFRGHAQTEGYLDDYALLGIAFLDLNEATGDSVWRDRATQLATTMLKRFSRGNSLVTTLASNELLIAPQDDGDNTAPSGTSAALELLLRLSAATGKQEYAIAASHILSRLNGALREQPSIWASAVTAINRYPLPAHVRTTQETAAKQSDVAWHDVPSTENVVHAVGEAHSAGDRDEIDVTIRVDDGYHVNANPASFDYLIPTTLSVAGVAGIRVAYPDAKIIKPKFAREGLKVYEGSIKLIAMMPKGALARGKPVNAELGVQACNDEICLPPAKLPLTIRYR
jgi:uncharacterized protein YyaL (SSP411 family)